MWERKSKIEIIRVQIFWLSAIEKLWSWIHQKFDKSKKQYVVKFSMTVWYHM